jgi:manganese/iron transport system ATP-binding protein
MNKKQKQIFPFYRHVRHDPSSPILDVNKLSIRYDGTNALENISFRLHAGERVAVVGPNGAGKSTLFKAIAGVIQPNAGDIKVSGFSPRGHICIAYVPQRSQVDWRFPASVADVVMMGRIGQIGLIKWPGHHDWAMVHQALDDVGMNSLADKQIGELSGGQQQRTFLARALAQGAELILLDEPLNGLDVPSQDAILNILEKLHNQGITVMVATHDLGQAAAHFDRVMLLNHSLIKFGIPADVLTSANLILAYGGHAQLIQDREGIATVTDTCCDGDDE